MSCTVVKIGGSILATPDDYDRVARLLAARIIATPTWVVVSAARGVTDTLRRLARNDANEVAAQLVAQQARNAGGVCSPYLAAELDRCRAEARAGRTEALLAWGELASAAALRGRLAASGVDLPIVELSRVRPPPLRDAIVPGFYLRDRHGRPRPLPRGGTDISAALVALWRGASEVRYWKEGGGIRLDGGVGTLERIGPQALLARLGTSIHPLHPAAVRIAQRHRIGLVLEDPWGTWPATHVSVDEVSNPALSQRQTLQASVGQF